MHSRLRGPRAPIHRFLAAGTVLTALGAGLAAIEAGFPDGAAAQEPPAAAQERQVVSSQVTVSGTEAGLVVELADGEDLSVRFRGGQVAFDGEPIGAYEVGGPLESAWRALLGRAIPAEAGELGALLRGWSAPPELTGDDAATARELEARLERALAAAAPSIRAESDLQELVERVVLSTDRLRALASAVRGIPTDEVRVRVGGDVRVPEGERLEGSLLVLEGDLVLEGEVTGDVLVLGGAVTLGETARIGRDLRWIDARVSGNRGAVAGRIVQVQPVPDRPESELREEIRRDVHAAVEAATRRDVDRPAVPFFPGRLARTPFLTNLARGTAQLIQTAITFAILLGLGLVLLYFAPRNFEVVARTARHAPGRSVLVGLAGGLLALPTWIIGIVALTITIIGIPVMVLWLPLFPLAVALAITAGYLAVARNLGRWASDRPIHGLESLDPGRPAVQLGAGLLVLLGAFALAGIFQMGGPWLSLFRGLLVFFGVVLTVLAGLVGFGALLLSRGGRDPLYAGPGWSAAEPPVDPWEPEPWEGPAPEEPAPEPGAPEQPAPEEDPDAGRPGGSA